MNRRNALLGAAALAACGQAASTPPAPPFPMRRGVNLGNALEAPSEGEWGYRIEAAHLTAIATAGFDGVRLPVRWDAHATPAAPYLIAPDFLARVDEVVAHTLGAGLQVQLDMHHYGDLIDQGPGSPHRERFLRLWQTIAEHYRDAPPALSFELLNEPHGELWADQALEALQRDAIVAIRESNPHRLIVLGPGNWNSIDALTRWTPVEADNVAVSVHYYEPHAFTHQDGEWLGADAPRFGRAWGTQQDRDQVVEHIARAARWANDRGVPLQVGEFGANRAVPLDQRALWTRTVRQACEAQGLGWCVWDFAGAFPIWQGGSFIPELRSALLGR